MWVLALLTLAATVWPVAVPNRPGRGRLASDTRLTGPLRSTSTRSGKLPSRLSRLRRSPSMTAADIADAAELLTMGLRSGAPPVRAVEVVLPDCPDAVTPLLRSLAEDLRRGESVEPTLSDWTQRHPELAPVSAAWALSERVGVALAPALDQAARSSREIVQARRRVEAAGAGARATMWLLTALPMVGLGAAVLLGVTPAVLVGEPAALVSIAVGVLLTGVGWTVSTIIVRRATRPGVG